ncbi:hypothetical protein HJC23_001082 [Cyclotella cryptica]|uniref:polyribonucleotide nucleotidyltransferase n=1 Tax=Cyclotella cryptica TaxID=29204 RepID=A0ABD3QJW6_9STRA|eukprot:CCRYP_005043-RA/>CCRYP_005043-RA protein AED:0.04 eAED:0.04 QI:70/1/1/1/1/1/7/375/1297
MSACFRTANTRLHRLNVLRHQGTLFACNAMRTEKVRTVVHGKNTKPTETAAYAGRYFSSANSIHNFNPSAKAKRSHNIEVPPLDLLSCLDVAAGKTSSIEKFNPPTSDGTPPETPNRTSMEIPALDLISALNTHGLEDQRTSPSKESIPYYAIGDNDNIAESPTGSSQYETAASSNSTSDLTEQISQLKMKLNNKNLSNTQRRKLKHRLQRKKNHLMRVIRTRKKRNTPSILDRMITDTERSPPTITRHASKSVLPQPKVSSKGVLLPDFDSDVIQTQASGTILARSGTTSVLSTVILVPPITPTSTRIKNRSFQETLLDSIQQRNARNGSLFLPLQVEYRERYHASGKIPTHNLRRRDNTGPLSEREVLTSRAIDRTLRPWLMMGLAESKMSEEENGKALLPENIVLSCQVQSYDTRSSTLDEQRTHADPTSLAINSAVAAMYQSAYSGNATKLPIPVDAAACIKLAMKNDGTVIYDPTPDEVEECAFELLYAGTKNRVLMFEFSAKGGSAKVPPTENNESDDDTYKVDPGIPEDVVSDALRMAQEAIVPIIRHQEERRHVYQKSRDLSMEMEEESMSDDDLARVLGLSITSMSSQSDGNEVKSSSSILFSNTHAHELLDEAYSFIWSKLEPAALKSFGCDGDNSTQVPATSVHICKNRRLPSKKLRGRRETLIQNEVSRLLREVFRPENDDVASAYLSAISESDSTFLTAFTNHIHERIMQQAFRITASRGYRSDSRNLHEVRPITATAPFFPDCVHGSSQFSRGETQVLCTATISAPRDGIPIVNPYLSSLRNEGDSSESKDDEKIPIGSLRFLRSQVEMESDMNSRRVKAGRELTGDSGILSEVKRAFLHYDFPDFSTGTIKSRTGGAMNRRAIGHGNLAERAILPVLPRPDIFPYSIRLTCEVTSSNGSSSMASACGATLSLLDAGVPLIAPVAGVSVGLASDSDTLLLDITGTEDHFGNMDCKVCGTIGGITAIQCDVKNPLELEVIINALNLAKEGRHTILQEMENACVESLGGLIPRASMKSTAPRVEVIRYDPNRKRDLIGPGGSVLRQLEDRFNVTLDLSQEGRCLIFGSVETVKEAKNVILDLVGDVEVGGIYEGTVIEIKDYGAVVELLRNKEGLLHVSEIADIKGKHPGGNLGLVQEYLKVGEKVQVLCTKIDHVQGSIKLSRKKLLNKQHTHQTRTKINNYEEIESNHEYLDESENYTQYDSASKGSYQDLNDDYENHNVNGDDLWEKDDDSDDSMNSDIQQEADSYLLSLNIPQLKEKLRNAGLPVSGKKSELIERLVNNGH